MGTEDTGPRNPNPPIALCGLLSLKRNGEPGGTVFKVALPNGAQKLTSSRSGSWPKSGIFSQNRRYPPQHSPPMKVPGGGSAILASHRIREAQYLGMTGNPGVPQTARIVVVYPRLHTSEQPVHQPTGTRGHNKGVEGQPSSPERRSYLPLRSLLQTAIIRYSIEPPNLRSAFPCILFPKQSVRSRCPSVSPGVVFRHVRFLE